MQKLTLLLASTLFLLPLLGMEHEMDTQFVECVPRKILDPKRKVGYLIKAVPPQEKFLKAGPMLQGQGFKWMTRRDVPYPDLDHLYVGTQTKRQIDKLVRHLKKNPPQAGGCLLTGETGTGKTSLAHALAYASGRTMIYSSFSSFCEQYQGLAAYNLRKEIQRVDLITQRYECPTILFLENFACLSTDINHPECAATLGEFLDQVQELKAHNPYLYLISTYYGEPHSKKSFSEAFDYYIHLELPDKNCRARILQDRSEHYRKTLSPCSAQRISKWTDGWNGFNLDHLIRSICERDHENKEITTELLEEAYTEMINHRRLADGRPFLFKYETQIGVSVCLSLLIWIIQKPLDE